MGMTRLGFIGGNAGLADLLNITDNEDDDIQFIVEDSFTTNNSVAFLSRATMNSRRIWSGVAGLLKGKLGRKTAVTVLPDEDDNMEGDKVRMNSTVRSKVGVAVGDSVKLGFRIKEVNYGKKISVRPVSDFGGNSTALNSTDSDLQRENLLEAYLRPYFCNAYRPVHQGDAFIVDLTEGGKKIKFEVVKTDPSPFCIVAPGTTVEISWKDASLVQTSSASIRFNQPSEEAVSTSRSPPSKKRKPKAGKVLAGAKKSERSTLTTVSVVGTSNHGNDHTTTDRKGEVCTTSNDVDNAKVNSDVNLNLQIEPVTAHFHSREEIQNVVESLHHTNALILEHKSCFVNPLLSQLESWSNEFQKLEQVWKNESQTTTTEQVVSELTQLLKDSAVLNLAAHLLKRKDYTTALEISEVMFRQPQVSFGIKSDTIFLWLLHKIVSRGGLSQAEDALKLIETFEKKGNQIVGYDQRHILKAKYFIGLIFKTQKKYLQALCTMQNVHDQLLILGGTDDFDALAAKFQVAVCMDDLEIYEEALNVFQSVYEKRNALLGPIHKNTLEVQYNIAFILSKQKKRVEALSTLDKIYKVMADTLGPEHPDSLSTQKRVRNCVGTMRKQWKDSK